MIYFDNAATTWPKPEEVYVSMDHFFRKYGANPGRAGHRLAAAAGRAIYEVREKIAEFFGAQNSAEIIFTSSATHSLNIAIQGLLEKGDHVITSCLEHNSVIRPLKELERKGIIELNIVGLDESNDLDYEAIERAIKPNTKLVAMTHGSNVTGHILDLQRISNIAKKHNIFLLVDAAQTAGVFPIDVKNLAIDLLALPGHKSLYGPPGTGILYIKTGTPMKVVFAGGTGSKSEEFYQPEILPDKFESGTLNSVGIIGLGAGLDFIRNVGLAEIREHEIHLTKILLEGMHNLKNLKVYGPLLEKTRIPVVSFNIGKESSSEVGYILDQIFDIAVRSGLHCAPLAHQTMQTIEQGMVRASFGYFNTVQEIDQLLQAINKITQKTD